jgi:regulation of enolase protein 1 (concanavalin A-like superfamily)
VIVGTRPSNSLTRDSPALYRDPHKRRGAAMQIDSIFCGKSPELTSSQRERNRPMKRLGFRMVQILLGFDAMLCGGAVLAAADDVKDPPPAAAAGLATAQSEQDAHPVAVLRDDFNGKFALRWKIIREDQGHVSLTKDPGHLTITMQRGTIHGDVDHDTLSEGIRAKNIFLIRSPLAESSDFSITLAVSKFEPTTFFQQVGLICYDDDENYVKWSFEYSWAKPDTTNFVMVRQTDKVPEHDLVTELKILGRFWLRVTRHETDYECAYSTDGRSFTVAGSRPWGKHPPKYVGFLAKNGGNPQAGEIDVSIDSFELRSPPIGAGAAGEADGTGIKQ